MNSCRFLLKEKESPLHELLSLSEREREREVGAKEERGREHGGILFCADNLVNHLMEKKTGKTFY